MTREQAMKEARKRWGARAMIRAHERLSSPEQREAAAAEVRAMKDRRDAIEREINERLAALDWYQQLTAERKDVVKNIEQNRWRQAYYKFAVGSDMGFAFHVRGSGDTWEQAFANATSELSTKV